MRYWWLRFQLWWRIRLYCLLIHRAWFKEWQLRLLLQTFELRDRLADETADVA